MKPIAIVWDGIDGVAIFTRNASSDKGARTEERLACRAF